MPPLNALKAFEATARLKSGSMAAVELHVTPGAISHQVRALEEFLGVDLFRRNHRQLTLTSRGEQYFQAICSSFDNIRLATRTLKHPRAKESLRVRAYTTFSLRWLIPRMSSFYAMHQSAELVLSTSNEPVDFSRDQLDFAIRLGDGNWPTSVVYRLIPNVVTPVCSPALLSRGPVLRKPADLVQHMLLQSTWPERRDDWNEWLGAEGINRTNNLKFLYFESSALSYQAAIEGHGVAMAQLALVENDLAVGRLIRPFERTLDRKAYTYYLIHPQKSRITPQMRDFRDWLLTQCKSD
jgi:LysR family glycine cleavage system transcriptional activator